jgi:hypothetical protein
MLITFFDSQDVVHKKFVPEGKTVNAEFYKGVIDYLLKHIQQVHPAAFCSRDFLNQKSYNPISPLILSRFISTRLFSVPQVENEVIRTRLCGYC